MYYRQNSRADKAPMVTGAELLSAGLEAMRLCRPQSIADYGAGGREKRSRTLRLAHRMRCYIRSKLGQVLSTKCILALISKFIADVPSNTNSRHLGRLRCRKSRRSVAKSLKQHVFASGLQGERALPENSMPRSSFDFSSLSFPPFTDQSGSTRVHPQSASGAGPHSSMSRRRLASNKPVLLRQIDIPPAPMFPLAPTPTTLLNSVLSRPVLRIPHRSPHSTSPSVQRAPQKDTFGFIFPVTPLEQVVGDPAAPPLPSRFAYKRSSWLDLASRRVLGESALSTSPFPFTPLEEPTTTAPAACPPLLDTLSSRAAVLPAQCSSDSVVDRGLQPSSAEDISKHRPALSRPRRPSVMAPAGLSVQAATAFTRDSRLRTSSLRTTRIGLPRRLSYQCCSSLPQTPLNEASNEIPWEYRGLGSPAMISVARVHPISDKGTQSGNTPRSCLSTPIGALQVDSNPATYFFLPALNKEPSTSAA